MTAVSLEAFALAAVDWLLLDPAVLDCRLLLTADIDSCSEERMFDLVVGLVRSCVLRREASLESVSSWRMQMGVMLDLGSG